MRKYFCLVLIFVLIFFLHPNSISASLVMIDPDGGVTVNVLADETVKQADIVQNDSLIVDKAATLSTDENSKITLNKSASGVAMTVLTANDIKTLDVSNVKDNVVEIEARPEAQKLAIRVDGSDFLIEQPSVVAKTSYEITVDPAKARLMLDAPSGNRTLSITPSEATQTLLRAKTISDYQKEGSVLILETDDHELTYEIKGQKVLNFFNFYFYPVDVTGYVSALTGEIVSVNQPIWLDIVGFLFV